VATIAAQMTGNELVVEVDADPVGIGFDRHSAVSVCGGDGILIDAFCPTVRRRVRRDGLVRA
jgi:hypothetical protein